MRVEVVYAQAGRAWCVGLRLDDDACVTDALAAAAPAMNSWPEEARDITRVAVFGREVDPATALHDGDRVELLRPLQRDPKDTRRLRAEQNPLKRVGRGA